MLENQFYLSILERVIPLDLNTQLTQAEIPELYPFGYDGIIAVVNPNPQNPSILGLKNCSNQIWTATLSNGEIRQIAIGRSIKLEEQVQIDFGAVTGIITQYNSKEKATTKFDFKKIQSKLESIKGYLGLIIWLYIFLGIAVSEINSWWTSTQNNPSSSSSSTSDDNACAGIRQRLENASISYLKINAIYQNRFPDGPYPIDPNNSSHQPYQNEWCKIADELLTQERSGTIPEENYPPDSYPPLAWDIHPTQEGAGTIAETSDTELDVESAPLVNGNQPNSKERLSRQLTKQLYCGESYQPGDTWWVVKGPKDTLDIVKNDYCGDAYSDNEEVQVAGFRSEDAALHFANTLSNDSGYSFYVTKKYD
ncbi:MAG: hypothetical protein VKL42_06165 [Snowella sp.]|nr:hypothetical protein [Snowella sp.]